MACSERSSGHHRAGQAHPAQGRDCTRSAPPRSQPAPAPIRPTPSASRGRRPCDRQTASRAPAPAGADARPRARRPGPGRQVGPGVRHIQRAGPGHHALAQLARDHQVQPGALAQPKSPARTMTARSPGWPRPGRAAAQRHAHLAQRRAGALGVCASSTAGMPRQSCTTLPGNSSTASARAVVMAWCNSAGASARQALAL